MSLSQLTSFNPLGSVYNGPVNQPAKVEDPPSVIDNDNKKRPPSFKRAHDNLRDYFIEKGWLNSTNEWTGPKRIPPLNDVQTQQFNSLLDEPSELRLTWEGGSFRQFFMPLRFLLNMFATDFDMNGSGVAKNLGENYYTRFLLRLGVPRSYIVKELFDDIPKNPSDYDFRLYFPYVDDELLPNVSDLFFQSLAEFIGLPVEEVKAGILNKWFSKEHHPDKYAIVKLHFYDGEKKKFTVDLLFIKKIRHPYFCRRDALRLHISPQKNSRNFSLSLESDLLYTEEAIAHFLTRTQHPDGPETISKCVVLLLIGITKGRLPFEAPYFANNYSALSRQPSCFDGLHDSVLTHYPGQPLALLATAFNAVAFLGRENGFPATQKIGVDYFPGSSLIESVYKTALLSQGGFEVVQDLLTVHAHLGWIKNVDLYHRDAAGMIELRCWNDGCDQPLSIFVKDSLEKALCRLVDTLDWQGIGNLSSEWLKESSLKGLPIDDSTFNAVEALFRHQHASAKSLAFYLLLKRHKDFPSNKNIDRLLVAFAAILAEEGALREECLAGLFEVLIESSCSYSREVILRLQQKALSLSDEKILTPLEFAKLLYQEKDLQKIALQISLTENPSAENLENALALHYSSNERVQKIGLPHFIKMFSRFETKTIFPLFLDILEAIENKCDYDDYKKSIHLFLSKLEGDGLSALPRESYKRAKDLLKKYDAAAAKYLASSAKNNPAFFIEALNGLKADIEERNDFHACKSELCDYLFLQNNPTYQVHLQDLVHILFNKFANSHPNELFAFLFRRHICQLMGKKPRAFLSYCIDLSQTLDSNAIFPTLTCVAIGKAAADLEPNDELFPTAAIFFIEQFEKSMNWFIRNRTPLASLLECTEQIIPLLESLQMWKPLLKLLEICHLIKLKPHINEPTAKNVLLEIAVSPLPTTMPQLTLAMNAYSTVKESFSNPSADKIKEQVSSNFAEAYLLFNDPQKAFQWILQLPSPKQLINKIADQLFAKKDFNTLETVLRLNNGQHFDPADLRSLWLKLAEAIVSENPEKSARILLTMKSGSADVAAESVSLGSIKELAKRLAGNAEAHHKILAYKLVSAYEYPSDNLWDVVISSCAKSLNHALARKAWSDLVFYHPTAKPSTKHALLKKLIELDLGEPSLLQEIPLFYKSPYNKGSAKEQILSAQLIYENAVLILRSRAPFSLSFGTLNHFRSAFTTEDEKLLIQNWLTYAPQEARYECLQTLADHYSDQSNFQLIPSKELISAIAESIDQPHNFMLYRFFLKILTQQKFDEKLVKEEAYASALLKLIPVALAESTRAPSLQLAFETLSMCNVHDEILTKTEERILEYLRIMIKSSSLLLTCDNRNPQSAHMYVLYCSIYVKFFDKALGLQERKPVLTDGSILWKYRNMLMSSLFNEKITLKASKKLSLQFLNDVFVILFKQLLIEEPSIPYEKKCEKLRKDLSRFVFSLRPDDHSEIVEIYKNLANNFFYLADAHKLYVNERELEIAYYLYINKRMPPVAQGYEIHRAIGATIAIDHAAVFASAINSRKAYEIFENVQSHLIYAPNEASATINALMNLLESFFKPNVSDMDSLQWMEKQLRPFLLRTLNVDVYKNIPNLPVDSSKNIPGSLKEFLYKHWKRQAPALFSKYMNVLDSFRQEHKKKFPSEQLPQILYDSALMTTLYIKNNPSIFSHPKSFHEAFFLFLEIFADYKQYPHRADTINKHISILLKISETDSPSQKMTVSFFDEIKAFFEGDMKLPEDLKAIVGLAYAVLRFYPLDLLKDMKLHEHLISHLQILASEYGEPGAMFHDPIFTLAFELATAENEGEVIESIEDAIEAMNLSALLPLDKL